MHQLNLFEQLQKSEGETIREKVDSKSLTKVYYTISEVAKMFTVNASLIRYWEKEFPEQFKNLKRNKKGDRYFNQANIDNLNVLYYLLKEKRMTLEGAKGLLKQNKKVSADIHLLENLQEIRSFLANIKDVLKES